MDGFKSSRHSPLFETLAAVCLMAVISVFAVWWFYQQGYLLYYGDAMAHLNIARRVVDSRTPGFEQLGTVWLPLPHLLMLPFIGNDSLWRSGLAGAIPSSICLITAGGFLFASVRRLFQSAAIALAAMLLFALNPNVLYLGSIPMTEPVFLACFFALIYFTILFHKTQSVWAVAAAGVATLAATLTRYEAWFLIPFVSIFFLIAAKQHRLLVAVLYGAIASSGPIYWLAYNWWYYGDVLEFCLGPYSAKAIYERSLASGMRPYAGDGEWGEALRYYAAAVRLCGGWALVFLAAAGFLVSLWKRIYWPLLLPLLLLVFYVWSIHSGSTPIFVPHLWPSSYYNTRYGLAAMPLLVIAASSLAAAAPGRFRLAAAIGITCIGISTWIFSPSRESWICWKESQVNSVQRRAWIEESAEYIAANYKGGGIITSFGDLTGIFQHAGVSIRETLHNENAPLWQGSVARPELFLREEWAVTFSGDQVATAILRAGRNSPRYERVKMIALRGARVVEVYRRVK